MQSYKTSQVGGRASQVGGNPSKVVVATSSIMNIKLKILVIEKRKKTLTVVVMNTRSQQYRLTVTKLELILVTRL